LPLPATGARRFRDLPWWRQAVSVLLMIVLVPLLALCAYLLLLVVGTLVGLAVGGAVFFAGVATWLIERWLLP
jgi:hypothetical protein